MTERQITAREKELQSYFRMHPRLNLEFKAMMSRLLREHRIDVTPETLSRLTVSLDRTGADIDSDDVMIPPPPKDDDDRPHRALEPSGMGEPMPIIGPPDDALEPGGEDREPGIGLEPGIGDEPGSIKK